MKANKVRKRPLNMIAISIEKIVKDQSSIPNLRISLHVVGNKYIHIYIYGQYRKHDINIKGE